MLGNEGQKRHGSSEGNDEQPRERPSCLASQDVGRDEENGIEPSVRDADDIDHGRPSGRVLQWHCDTHQDDQEGAHEIGHDSVDDQGFAYPRDVVRFDPRLCFGVSSAPSRTGVGPMIVGTATHVTRVYCLAC